MDFETFIESLFKFIQNGGNAYFVLYALATCILTQAAKKLFVNKVKVDVLHKFDVAVILPFIFGAAFAAVDVFAVRGIRVFDGKIVVELIVNSAAIGALASTVFKLISSLSGKSLSKLMSDDVFGMFYTQLLYYGNARKRMLDKQLTLRQFVDEVKLISSNALKIYQEETDEETKRQNLAKLLNGIIDDDSIAICVTSLNKALINYFANETKDGK